MHDASSSGSEIPDILSTLEKLYRQGDPEVVSLIKRLAAAEPNDENEGWLRVVTDAVVTFAAKVLAEVLKG